MVAQSEHKAPAAPAEKSTRRHVLHIPSRIWTIDHVVRRGIIRGGHGKFHKAVPCEKQK
jgi:hypothetical protein